MESNAHGETLSTVLVALVANGAIALLKFLVALFSGSIAMLAEGFHSLADTGNQLFLLLGIRSSTRPPDDRHPFGYGQDSYFWSFVVAVSMFTMGAVVSLYKGLQSFLHPHEIAEDHLVYGAGVLVAAIVFESFALRKAWYAIRSSWDRGGFVRHLRELKDTALLTVFFEDVAALIGLAIALAGLAGSWLTGNAWWDAGASVLIGLLLAGVAFLLAYETRTSLLGERASPRVVNFIHSRLTEEPSVRDFEPVRSLQLGPGSVLVTARIRLRPGLSLQEADGVNESLKQDIRDRFPSVRHIYFEFDHESPVSPVP